MRFRWPPRTCDEERPCHNYFVACRCLRSLFSGIDNRTPARESTIEVDSLPPIGKPRLMKLRAAILGALSCGGLLLVVLAVAGALCGILAAVGDQAAVGALRAIVLLTCALLALDLVVLIVLTALAALQWSQPPYDAPSQLDEE